MENFRVLPFSNFDDDIFKIDSFFRIWLKHFDQKLFDRFWDQWIFCPMWQIVFCSVSRLYSSYKGNGASILERKDSKKHFIKNGSSTVNLGFIIILLSFENFRSHVKRSSWIGFEHLIFGIFGGKSKINNFDIFLFEHDVSRFKITMNDIGSFHGHHSFE